MVEWTYLNNFKQLSHECYEKTNDLSRDLRRK
jgi:hypothetical protein